ncbi:50S ribosomal protein L18 [Candidatus Uhrbacteria bacterium CG_4_9_14_0_2_um_filter_41_50]|uniref:Large ribosomal subunit protein uL18 n=1 Tax=Candidatus Uhrbacteria bacterium CG_4_9_14_0_2_um_filter_41_50 TaxID=1975031 RepID=A0A2M8EQA2_9BACT|nr:MAG: 50S ribosomal protein L18 [Candidatus Uhrbacteria bacterium CG_4_10_14_3_um_filter_41_21]PIZ55243.1 MAG: 50S ribosomal protein L18 [Candidatus Uhrbacteria bacterium CG_4_10_14_0_2_um_filter_41_21]PJB84381.1 MAG: 50S ribosomal protein L18 [Candidatus Uhrbacteria bacterium CG_4_9_14_0_8_um_filter_41_16]PJC24923.1 MAG: 50S ribosomal protein L18 [Candidatus Uhrbacteria bacterium CG_4_9_14_0_2_um_filter_41_50]PJE74985.1 MAG: 50S ribosomal protein L18 [Candidatus Uhrbacteria bacterium CG10_bi
MSKEMKKKLEKKIRRAKRTRSHIRDTAERPRLSVSRSLKHISAQIIDDQKGVTIASAFDIKLDLKGKTKTDIAALVGTEIGKKAKEAGVTKVVFDRGPYLFHGRVKALAEAARNEGLEF